MYTYVQISWYFCINDLVHLCLPILGPPTFCLFLCFTALPIPIFCLPEKSHPDLNLPSALYIWCYLLSVSNYTISKPFRNKDFHRSVRVWLKEENSWKKGPLKKGRCYFDFFCATAQQRWPLGCSYGLPPCIFNEKAYLYDTRRPIFRHSKWAVTHGGSP